LVFLIAASLAAFLLHRHTEWVMVTGEVEARQATISSPTAGILAPVSVRIGKLDRVRQGDVIARVESESSPAAQSQALRDLTRLHSQSSATQATEIRAPLSGCVTDVYLHPGQFVQSGQPILELVEEEASHIIAYIRQDQRVRPVRGMAVQVHLQSDPAHAYESYVETVGVQMVRLPDPMLRDHKTPEWGLPVRIAIPPTAGLRPGDSVNVVFKPDILPAQSPVQVPSTKTSPTPKRTLPLHLATAQPLQPTVGSFR
jgi:multidrug resistance efflux pump